MDRTTMPRLAAERQQFLLDQLRSTGRITTADAAAALETSGETVRKDLIELERRGLLRRVHGGALHVEPMTFEPDVEHRHENVDEKARIATAALELVPHAGGVVLDAGTTVHLLAGMFPNRHLTVFTNALMTAAEVATREAVAVSTFGGRVRPVTRAQVGARTVATIQQMHFDIAFVGTNAISRKRGLSTPDPEEAEVKRAMIEASERVVLLVDHTKFAQRSLARYADLTDVDVIVTGSEVDAVHRGELDDAGIEVIYA